MIKPQRPKNHRWQGPPPTWKRHRGYLFFWLLAVFGFVVLLLIGGMLTLAFLFNRRYHAAQPMAMLFWLSGCGLALFLPILAGWVGRRAFRGIAAPLADIMAAAEAVAAGDLTTRVAETYPGQFNQLAHAFNHMTQELARADQQRRNLTADVAHELRTPLHIIQGNLEGVLDGVYDPNPDHIEATLDETRRLARLVDDLQTLSLAEAGQLPLHVELTNLGELVEDITTSFSGQAEALGITLHSQTPNEPLIIAADPGRLEQVLGNLIINALRHTPAGGKVGLTVLPIAEGAQLTVHDNGEGIAAADLPFIFDRFWRGDRARSHQLGVGGGLGLAIVRQLVQAHGGTIHVTSEPGQSTTFTITLPN